MGRRISTDPAISIPVPGEYHRAGVGLGTAITIEGDDENGDLKYTGLVTGVRVIHLGGISQTLNATVAGLDVTIQLGTDMAGVVTSDANDVVAEIAATPAAAALVSAVAQGDGTGLAATTVGWTKLDGGAQGSIHEVLLYLAQYAGGWSPPRECYSSNGTTIHIRGMRSLHFGWSQEQDYEYTPASYSAAWHYVYAYVDTDGLVAYEDSTAGPDAYLQFKGADSTRRFVTCYRGSGAGTLTRFYQSRTYYAYEGPAQMYTLRTATTWTALGLSAWFPPHVRIGDLEIEHVNGEAALNFVQVRATGTTPATPITITVSGGAGNAVRQHARVFMDGSQQIDYQLDDNTSTNSSAGFLAVGWPL